MSRMRIGAAALALVVSLLGFGAGVAAADRGGVIIEPPIFVPQSEFPTDNGYYRTNEGTYYHYDRDRNGWHYGRNHEEGLRYEHEHGHEHEGQRGEHRR